jgi:Protein of unknown function (DUF3052)
MDGYSTNPLFKKLGMKEGATVKLIHPPENYPALIGEVFDKLLVNNKATIDLDLIHFFTNSQQEFEKLLPALKLQIKKNGMIWVSWYKRSAKKPTEITEDIVRDTALAIGLVDVKVCAVDQDWSGLKLVFRRKDR